MTPEARGDLAESLVPVAAELAFLVRDEGRKAIGEWLDAHGVTDDWTRALLVVLAARSSVDITDEQAYDWVTWDEHGAPLEQTIPLLPCVPVPAVDPACVSVTVPGQPAAGAAIREARSRAGMSQRDLAAEAGVGHRTLRGWESGERAVRHGHWVVLQLVLGPLGVVRDRRAGAGQEQQRGDEGRAA